MLGTIKKTFEKVSVVSCRPCISYCIHVCIACAQLQSLYHGIPRSVVEKFVSLCPSCQLRKPQLSTAPLKPIIANGLQVHIIACLPYICTHNCLPYTCICTCRGDCGWL